MPAAFGDNTPSSYYFGDQPLDALAFGDTLLWSSVVPVAYHVTGDGFNYNTNAKTDSGSFSINGVAADDVVIVFTSGDDTTSPTLTYGGSAMTQLSRIPFNNNGSDTELQCYGIVDTTGGSKTISWTGNAPGTVILNAVAYSGASLGATTTAYGSGSPASHTVTCNPGEMIVQAFGASQATWTPSGGTNRSNTSSSNNTPLLISDSDQSATFSATGSVGTWASIAVVLLPA